MGTLTAPLRVTWEVPADAALAVSLFSALAQGRALFVEAEVDEGCAPAFCAALAAGVPPGMRVSVLGPADALRTIAQGVAAETLSRLDFLLLFDPRTCGDFRAEGCRSLSVALYTTPKGLEQLAPAWDYVTRRPGVKLALLNPHAPAAPLTREDRAKAAALGVDPDRATVHDLFLAEALGCKPFDKYAGCAACESLAHLTAQGFLTACRTLPALLGSLADEPLKALWADPVRAAIRKALVLPKVCAPCALAPVCKGGCPGLAGDDGRDASCPGVRARPDAPPNAGDAP